MGIVCKLEKKKWLALGERWLISARSSSFVASHPAEASERVVCSIVHLGQTSQLLGNSIGARELKGGSLNLSQGNTRATYELCTWRLKREFHKARLGVTPGRPSNQSPRATFCHTGSQAPSCVGRRDERGPFAIGDRVELQVSRGSRDESAQLARVNQVDRRATELFLLAPAGLARAGRSDLAPVRRLEEINTTRRRRRPIVWPDLVERGSCVSARV